ncbi:hypothetical protein ES703_60586 [subsurface metagenome]
MFRKRCITVLLVVVLAAIVACDSTPGMYCEDIMTTGRCIDGSWPQACVSYDSSRCGFHVRGKMFYCYSCQPLICDDAARAAVMHCYYPSYAADGVEPLDQDDQVYLAEMERLFLDEL